MAYLRVLNKGGYRYYYIVRSERKGATVRSKVLEYLGRDPPRKRLAEARAYWKVTTKRTNNRRRRTS